jgi:hypothetical protein
MIRTVRKLILAGALLAFAGLLPQSAQSATCCQNCLNRLNSCYAACAGDPTCESNCDNAYEGCALGCSRFGQHCPI